MEPSRGQLSRFAAIFAGGTLISRVLGLARDVVLNTFVSVGPREAFLVAFTLPNMLRDMVGEGAANAAFVPVFSQSLARDGEKTFREVAAAAFGAMLLVLLVLTVLGVMFVPLLLQGLNALHPVTGGKVYSAEELALVVRLSRWTFPYLFFIGLAVFSMAALFSVKHYSTPSWAPALLNVALIVCVFGLAGRLLDTATALVIGVWVGGIAQVAVQYWAMGKRTGVWAPSFQLFRAEVIMIFVLLGPVILGQAAGEVNKLVNTLFAYKSAEGSFTALYTANRLVQLPLSIFGFATAAAVLPAASRAAANRKTEEVRALLIQGLRQSFFLVVPAMIGLIVLGRPIIRLLFEYREFTPTNTAWTTVALQLYAAGLLSFAWVKVLVTGFYAVHDTRTPVLIAAGSMLLNVVLNVLLVGAYGYKGLALSTTVSYTVNFLALFALLSNRFGVLWDSAFTTEAIRMSAAAATMAAAGYGVYFLLAERFTDDSFHARLILAMVPVVVSVIGYVVFSKLFGVAEIDAFLRLLRPGRNEP
jgi:putative peptidoglycan lipid II flippase